MLLVIACLKIKRREEQLSIVCIPELHASKKGILRAWTIKLAVTNALVTTKKFSKWATKNVVHGEDGRPRLETNR